MVLKRHNNDSGIYKICFAGTTCGWTVASSLDIFSSELLYTFGLEMMKIQKPLSYSLQFKVSSAGL